MAMETKSAVEMETETTIAIRKKRDLLESFKIPFLRNAKALAPYLTDKKKLLPYLPNSLRRKCKPIPVDPKDEFVCNYVKKALEHALFLSLSSKSLGEVLITAIQDAEISYVRKNCGRGGWIMDDMLYDEHVLEEMFPDYIAD